MSKFTCGSIWRTCICEHNKIVIVIIMCSKLVFCSALNTLITITLQTYGALVGCTFCQLWFLKIKSESESEAEKSLSHRYGAKLIPCALAL